MCPPSEWLTQGSMSEPLPEHWGHQRRYTMTLVLVSSFMNPFQYWWRKKSQIRCLESGTTPETSSGHSIEFGESRRLIWTEISSGGLLYRKTRGSPSWRIELGSHLELHRDVGSRTQTMGTKSFYNEWVLGSSSVWIYTGFSFRTSETRTDTWYFVGKLNQVKRQ